MSARSKAVLFLILVTLPAGPLWADGKFFVGEEVPANLPYQRAFLLFDEGTETLVVQSKYELAPSTSAETLAWVVPVPSVPELAGMDAITAYGFFWTMSFRAGPRVWRVSGLLAYIPVAAFLVGVALLLLCLLEYPFIGKGKLTRATWGRQGKVAVWTILFGLFSVCFAVLPQTKFEVGGVEVVKSEQVGIYDVTVIRGDSAEPIVVWLRENGFAFDETDQTVFADYVQRGWCFVTAKVRPDTEANPKTTVEGMVAPLVLTFATTQPVYPLALTATGAAQTQILIYTLSPEKLDCGARLTLRHAHQAHSREVMQDLLVTAGPDEYRELEGLPDKTMMLCKFKGTLTAAQMRDDLVFQAASDNTPYRETKWIW